MSNILSQLKRDSILAWRNGHVGVVLVIMALMWLLIFFLPASLEKRQGELILDLSEGAVLRRAAELNGLSLAALAADKNDFERRMAENTGLIGVIAEGDAENLHVEILAGSHIPAANVALLRASVDELLRLSRGSGSDVRYPASYLESEAIAVPLNLVGVPIFLIFEAGILGFLLVAVFVFQEKQEGTLRAYRVAPGGPFPYIAAKLGVFVTLSVVYGAGVLAGAAIKGARPDWFGALVALALSSAFMTLFGLGFASFFRNLSHWFFPGLAVLLVNIVPFFSYSRPSFSPGWVKAIPSYDGVFLARDFVLNPASTADSALPFLRLGAWTLAAAVFAYVAVSRKLLKE
jgi:ABC-2 type transport system permease protein/fluoroquinolone transport system permease protein